MFDLLFGPVPLNKKFFFLKKIKFYYPFLLVFYIAEGMILISVFPKEHGYWCNLVFLLKLLMVLSSLFFGVTTSLLCVFIDHSSLCFVFLFLVHGANIVVISSVVWCCSFLFFFVFVVVCLWWSQCGLNSILFSHGSISIILLYLDWKRKNTHLFIYLSPMLWTNLQLILFIIFF